MEEDSQHPAHSQAKTFLKKKNNGHTCKLNATVSQTLSTNERLVKGLTTKLFLMAQLSKDACQELQQNTNSQRCRLMKAAQLISPEEAIN